MRHDLAPHFDNPRDLAHYLVQIDWLTDYQRRHLFAGRLDALTLGPYHLLDRLGEGGVSEVFKAWDTVKGRLVALKVLRQNLASQTEGLRQFQRERETVTQLVHPNIIKTFDAHQEGNVCWFAMEFVEGIDLHRYVTTYGPLPVEQACDYVRQVAQGLQYAHQLNLVHRDIKPANLFLVNPPIAAANSAPRRSGSPFVKILDWGLARSLQSGANRTRTATGDPEKGMLIGTADFAAPEQALDPSLVDTRADIYSLGCTLFFLLTGRPPFAGTSLMQKLMSHQGETPAPLRSLRPDAPEALEAVIVKMMAKRPEDRYQIPLLVVAPLRRFCPAAMGLGGSIIRPPTGMPVQPKPTTAPALPLPPGEAAKPSSSAVLKRPGSSVDLGESFAAASGSGRMGSR